MKKLCRIAAMFLLVMMVVLSVPMASFAAGEEFYAVLTSDNTLTFYYDAGTHKTEGTVYTSDQLPGTQTDPKNPGSKWGYHSVRSTITGVVIDKSVKGYTGLTDTVYMFSDLPNATRISGCENLNVSRVTNMCGMFSGYGKAEGNNITDVPNVSGWDTSNVTDMTGLFFDYGAYSTELNATPDVSKWDTGKVKRMYSLFAGYGSASTKLTVVPDVSGWNTGKVEDMTSMFMAYGSASTGLTAVPDVSKWDTSKVKTMTYLFMAYGAASTATLDSLDLSGWDITSLVDATWMFVAYGAAIPVNSRPVVYGTDWTTQKSGVTADMMFTSSTLKGNTDGAWDSANTSDTGCFTGKPEPGPVPSTGDNTPVALVAGLLALSGIALVVLKKRAAR